jgi:hypothetical protein
VGRRDGIKSTIDRGVNKDIRTVLELSEDMEVGAGDTEEKDDEGEADTGGDTTLDRDKDSDPESNLGGEEVPEVDFEELVEDRRWRDQSRHCDHDDSRKGGVRDVEEAVFMIFVGFLFCGGERDERGQELVWRIGGRDERG